MNPPSTIGGIALKPTAPPPKIGGTLAAPPLRVRNEASVTPWGSAPTGTRTTVSHVPIREFREPKPTDRADAVKTSRFLRSRLGLVAALFENTSRYALAGGLTPTSMSGDSEWDMRADDYFNELAGRKEFDVREEHTFYGMQSVLLPDVMTDGDAGALKVRAENGDPAIQLFPTESIGNGARFGKPIGKEWRDGIKRDKQGKPLAYRILEDPQPGKQGQKFHDYAAADFLHIGRFNRINLNRPFPWLAHGKDACIDILDLTALEKSAARLNSYFAAAITTATGNAPAGFEQRMTAQPESLTTTDKDGATAVKETTRHFGEFMGGAAIPIMGKDEKLEFFRNDRPSVTFSGFIDWLVNDVAWGFGTPPQFVWSLVGLPGPQARLIMQQADWFFRALQDIMVTRFCRPVRDGVIEDGLSRGRLPLPKAGADWKSCHWQGPQSMTIDKGRDGKLFLSLVEGGLMARTEWHEMSGKSGRRQRVKIIDEIAEDIAYCNFKGVPLEFYFGSGQAALPSTGPPGDDPTDIAEGVVALIEENGLMRGAQRWG